MKATAGRSGGRAVRDLAVAALVTALPACRLTAQCPDGAPPPCRTAAARAAPPNSVAVLYFDNQSRDSSRAYVAQGLTEEIIVNLGRIARLDVRSRNEVQFLRGAAQRSRALGQQLNVAYVVTGAVRPVRCWRRAQMACYRAGPDAFRRSCDA